MLDAETWSMLSWPASTATRRMARSICLPWMRTRCSIRKTTASRTTPFTCCACAGCWNTAATRAWVRGRAGCSDTSTARLTLPPRAALRTRRSHRPGRSRYGHAARPRNPGAPLGGIGVGGVACVSRLGACVDAGTGQALGRASLQRRHPCPERPGTREPPASGDCTEPGMLALYAWLGRMHDRRYAGACCRRCGSKPS